jgi:hypothetical protein
MSTVSYEVQPAIGVARLGSSHHSTAEGFFYGPEPGASPPAQYRDPAGDLKRQAAQFRFFRCVRDAGRRLPRRPASMPPPVASVTRQVTAYAVARLAQEGTPSLYPFLETGLAR